MRTLPFLHGRRAAVVTAVASSLLVASGQQAPEPPKLRPLTAREARREIADFEKNFRNRYVRVTPGVSVRLASGILVTVLTAEKRNGKLHVTGTLTNTASTPAAKSDYAFMLNQSYEEQVAHYRKVPVGLGVCESPCMTSHMEVNVEVESLPPGRSVPYTLDFDNFSEVYPHLHPSDMIMDMAFFPH